MSESKFKNKPVIPTEIFLKVHTREQLKKVSWQAMHDLILEAYGEASALLFRGSKSPSKHPHYTVAANAVTRAKKRAREMGWIQPTTDRYKSTDA